MRVIAITGASGFVGRHLVNLLGARDDIQVRILVHRNQDQDILGNRNVTPVKGDLMRTETLDEFLQPGCTVVNLAYLVAQSRSDNLKAMNNLANACIRKKIKRLVHCSTATVVGGTSDRKIIEETHCVPKADYEITKFEIEQMLVKMAYDHFELTILRPTAVFGPGGRNLLKLANDLTRGSRVVNYIKSSLYNDRCMNLVCVENVVSAIVFLIESTGSFDKEVFLIADDEDPANNYKYLEKYLMKRFGCRDYWLRPIRLPKFLFSMAMKLAGKTNTHPYRVYQSTKLMNAGFEKPVSFEEGLASFSDWYADHFLTEKQKINESSER